MIDIEKETGVEKLSVEVEGSVIDRKEQVKDKCSSTVQKSGQSKADRKHRPIKQVLLFKIFWKKQSLPSHQLSFTMTINHAIQYLTLSSLFFLLSLFLLFLFFLPSYKFRVEIWGGVTKECKSGILYL